MKEQNLSSHKESSDINITAKSLPLLETEPNESIGTVEHCYTWWTKYFMYILKEESFKEYIHLDANFLAYTYYMAVEKKMSLTHLMIFIFISNWFWGRLLLVLVYICEYFNDA